MKDLLVSVSGGRTSAFMAIWTFFNKPEIERKLGIADRQLKCHYVFANTGMEHEDTLRFLCDLDSRYSLGITWVEAIVHHGERKASGHRQVSYKTAFHNHQWEDPNHPFHSYIRKYGIPNVKFKSCTRELKLNPMRSYMRSIGLSPKEYWNAIGIRSDETRRVSPSSNAQNIVYPLAEWRPTFIEEIEDFLAKTDFDLQIPQYLGNCVACYKKSFRKLHLAYHDMPEVFEFCNTMEERYPRLGPEFEKYDTARDRRFFRTNMNTKTLIENAKATKREKLEEELDRQYDSGCSESCELYEMEG